MYNFATKWLSDMQRNGFVHNNTGRALIGRNQQILM